MASYTYLLDILKYTIAGLGVVWVAFYLIKPYLEKNEKIQLLEFKKAIANQTLPLRLQAYERIILFMERINPGYKEIRPAIHSLLMARCIPPLLLYLMWC